jgi:hypothetical protein
MAQKKLELNRGLRSVSGIVGAITGRASDEQDSPPLDRPEPPPDSAESAPAEVASELQPLDADDHPVDAADPVVAEEKPQGATSQRPRRSPKPDAQPGEVRGKEARRGRPPGQVQVVATAPVSRKKVTLMIRTDLVEKYNAWSWGAQCNVGRLYERALEDYYQRKGPKESK